MHPAAIMSAALPGNWNNGARSATWSADPCRNSACALRPNPAPYAVRQWNDMVEATFRHILLASLNMNDYSFC
jgi:hypothetical protein